MRIVAVVRSTARQVIPCLGLHRWIDSIVRKHPSIENEKSHIFMLVPQLRSDEALQENGKQHSIKVTAST
jgi:hypothetical protein